MQNLTSALLLHGSIMTSEAKAKQLRRFFEPLITRARGELTLNNRRRLQQTLIHGTDMSRLLDVAKEYQNRPGGYLRLTKVPVMRGDGARMVRIEFVK